MSEAARRIDGEDRQTSAYSTAGGRRLPRYARPRRARPVGRAYSRFVAVMKWLLPALALGLAGLVVLWPELEEAPIPTRSAMPSQELEAGQMANPRFAGVDDRNRPYSVTGNSASTHPDREGIVVIDGPEAEITLESGAWLALMAERGLLDNEEGHVRLEGSVSLFRDDGFTFASDEMEIDLRSRRAWGDEPVSAHGPSAEIAATGFRIEEGGRTVAFTGPTRLVMRGADGHGGDDPVGGLAP
jgi:lipopolysaccharide export system protein LptC